MLKYDYFSILCKLTDKSREAVEYACQSSSSPPQRIAGMRADSQKMLCELERALLAEFLPPLDRASIAAYAHALCEITDAAITYASLSPACSRLSQRGGIEDVCLSLCDLLLEGTALLQGIKKSSDAPKLEEFREKKGVAMRSLCEEALAAQTPRSSKIFNARRELMSSISRAFDVLVELILKNI